MNYPIESIYADIRTALDQNQSESALVDNDYTLQLDDVIAQKTLHAARSILEEAPYTMIDNGGTLMRQPFKRGDAEIGDGLYYYTLELPSDYLKLLSLKLSSWATTLHHAVSEDSEEADMARSEFLGIAGNPSRPVAVDDFQSSAERRLVIYSGDAEETLDRAVYCREPQVKAGMLNFPTKLYYTLIYRAAALVAVTYGDTAQAQTLMTLSGGKAVAAEEGGSN